MEPSSVPFARRSSCSYPSLWCRTVLTPAFRVAIGSMALYEPTKSSLIGVTPVAGFARRSRNSGVSPNTHYTLEIEGFSGVGVGSGFHIPRIGMAMVVKREIPILSSILSVTIDPILSVTTDPVTTVSLVTQFCLLQLILEFLS